MTLQNAVTTNDAKIEYLGGLANIAKHIPFSPKTLKDRIATPAQIDLDKDEWMRAAGFRYSQTSEQLYEKTGDGLAAFLLEKGIDEIDCDDAIDLLVHAATRLAALPEEEQEKLANIRDYFVTISIHGAITINVKAASFEEADELALEAFSETDIGDIYCEDHSVVYIKDDAGNEKLY